jgi:Aspartyl protease
MNVRIALAFAGLSIPCLLAGETRVHATHFDVNQGIPLVHVKIDGQGPFAFVIDTGTSCEAIVSPRLVKRLGLSATGRKSITDLGGHGTHSLATVDFRTLSLAGSDFRSVRAVVTDLPDGDSVLDGILGFGLFANQLLTLDYPRHRLTLEDGTLAGTNTDGVVQMRMFNGIPVVEIDVAGAKADAGIDSGGRGLSIPDSLISKVRFASSIDTVALGRTQVSSFALRGAVLDGAVELAGFRFERPWLEVNPVFSIANLGSGAMQDFIVTFDQRSKLVRFTSAATLHRLVKPRDLAATPPLDELVGTIAVTQSY